MSRRMREISAESWSARPCQASRSEREAPNWEADRIPCSWRSRLRSRSASACVEPGRGLPQPGLRRLEPQLEVRGAEMDEDLALADALPLAASQGLDEAVDLARHQGGGPGLDRPRQLDHLADGVLPGLGIDDGSRGLLGDAESGEATHQTNEDNRTPHAHLDAVLLGKWKGDHTTEGGAAAPGGPGADPRRSHRDDAADSMGVSLFESLIRSRGSPAMELDRIVITGARQHNLRHVTVEIPKKRLVVLTGVSGSGKSSLAFDTLYAEGQRRYIESLSAYARQFLGQMDKPLYDSIKGLAPTISIEQKTASTNPRSTVGTITEIHDYLRVLWARVGRLSCHHCGRPVSQQSAQQIVREILDLPAGHEVPGARAPREAAQGRAPRGDRGGPQVRLHPGAGGRDRGLRWTTRSASTRRRSTPSTWWWTG